MKLAEIASGLGLEVEGDGSAEIRGLAGLADAGPQDLSFATGAGYRAAFERSRAGAFLVPPDFETGGRARLCSVSPYADFARAVTLLYPDPQASPGVDPSARIAPGARVSPSASVGAYCVVGPGAVIGARTRLHPHVTVYADCEIGEDCELHSGVHLRSRVRLGDRVTVHNGAVIGSEGFGFAFRPDGTRLRVPHCCGVIVDDDVEIGANTTIDASHPGHAQDESGVTATRIRRRVKIDNQVQVAHGCDIGEGSTLCAQVGLAGRTVLDPHVFFGGQSASAGNLRVASGTAVLGMSGVMSDTAPGDQLVGVPAIARKEFFRILAASRRLPELLRRVRKLES